MPGWRRVRRNWRSTAEDDVADLPVSILPRVVEVAAPLDEEALAASSIEGEWVWTEDFPAYTCGNASGRVSGDAAGAGIRFRVDQTATGIRVTRLDGNYVTEHEQTGPGVYDSTTTVSYPTAGTGTMTYRIEFTSASGGVATEIYDYDLVYCHETIERSAAFARAD